MPRMATIYLLCCESGYVYSFLNSAATRLDALESCTRIAASNIAIVLIAIPDASYRCEQ